MTYNTQANFLKRLSKILYDQHQAEQFCDIKIEINSETIKAHQCVLAANSMVLSERIKTAKLEKDGEARIDITDLVPLLKTFQSVLEFYYTGEFRNKEAVSDLKCAAVNLGSQQLVDALKKEGDFPKLTPSENDFSEKFEIAKKMVHMQMLLGRMNLK